MSVLSVLHLPLVQLQSQNNTIIPSERFCCCRFLPRLLTSVTAGEEFIVDTYSIFLYLYKLTVVLSVIMNDFDGGLCFIVLCAFSSENFCTSSLSESIIFMNFKDKISYWVFSFFQKMLRSISSIYFWSKIHCLKVVVYFFGLIYDWRFLLFIVLRQ